MGIYNVCLIFIISGIIFHYILKNRRFDNLFVIITMLLLFVVASFRNCGYDYENYQIVYENCRDSNWENQDLGFAWLASILPSYRMLLVVMAALTMLPMYYCLQKLSPLPIFSLLMLYPIFLIPTIMGQMRQGVAMFFILTAYLVRHKKLLCIILMAASILMHTAALIGLLYFLPLRRKYHIALYLALFFVAIFTGPYIEHLLAYFIDLLGIPILTYKYESYHAAETLNGFSLGLNTAVLIRCFIFVLAYYMLSGTVYENHHFLNLYFLSIIIYLALGFIPQIGGRGSAYFSILDIFLIPQLICVAQSGTKRFVLSLGFILLAILRYVHFFSSGFNYTSYVPYVFTI